MTEADAEYVRRVCDAVSSRAAVLIAVTVFSLYRLQRDAHAPAQASAALDTALDAERPPVAVAYCGAVAEKHATARRKAQDVLDLLVEAEGRHCATKEVPRRLVLEGAADSGLLGAAVGAVMNDAGPEIRAKL
jgi:hexokinase